MNFKTKTLTKSVLPYNINAGKCYLVLQIRLRVGLGSEDDIKTNSFTLTKYKRMSCVKEGVKQTERCIEI